MKKKILSIISCLVIMLGGVMIMTGCGSTTGQNLEDYMKGQPPLRAKTDAQLNILSADMKASVQYTADNQALVTVQYYALTDDEIAAIEPQKAEVRCKSILGPVLEQFQQDTGNEGEIIIDVQGHKPE